MKIPAISGAEKDAFDTVFWKGVTARDAAHPLRGSVGVFWYLYKDLRDVTDLEKELVNTSNPRLPHTGVPYKAAVLTLLRAFFNFAQQADQPYFFIKRGTRPLWLVRKTGSYWYEDREDDPSWNPHRISFEFVRKVTEEEGRSHLGVGIKTLFMMDMAGEEPNLTLTSVEEMPPKKVVSKPTAKAAAAAPVSKAYAATYVETSDVPLIVEEVEVVKVVPLDVGGVTYLRDPVKHKVYRRTGVYVGRWSPMDETIHREIPNSDDE